MHFDKRHFKHLCCFPLPFLHILWFGVSKWLLALTLNFPAVNTAQTMWLCVFFYLYLFIHCGPASPSATHCPFHCHIYAGDWTANGALWLCYCSLQGQVTVSLLLFSQSLTSQKKADCFNSFTMHSLQSLHKRWCNLVIIRLKCATS